PQLASTWRKKMMRSRILLGALIVISVFAMATAAQAVTVNGVDYTILAKYKVLMEGSDNCPHDLSVNPPPPGKVCMNIIGNVGVSDPDNPADSNDGRLQIGSNNDIVGTAIADQILFGSFSQTDNCKFNTGTPFPSGPGANSQCITSIVNPLPAGTLPIVAAWPPGPLLAVPVNNCVNLAATPSVTVAAGWTLAIAPGCYKTVTVGAGGTLNLSAGSYVFKTLTLKAGATLNGNGADVNVQGLTSTEAGSALNDVTIKTPGTAGQTVTEFIIIGGGTQ